MFQRLITRYGLATHLALLASLPFALFPFLSTSRLAEVIFWLSGIAFLCLVVEPSMRAGEHLSIARRRVLSSMLRDVAFWFFVFAIVVSLVRYLNSDVALVYVNGEWAVGKPSFSGFPASTGTAGLLPLAVVIGLSVVVLGVRHGIGLTARISFGLTASFVMGLGGLAMVVFACLKVPSLMVAAKANFLDGPFWAPFWGPAFGVWLICALSFGAQAEARKWGAARVPFCLSVAGNASGLLFFSPPLVSTVFLVLAALVAVFCLAYLSRSGSMGATARNFVFVLLGFSTPLFFIFALLPPDIELDGCVRSNGSTMEAVKEPVQNIYAVKAGGFLAIDKNESAAYREISPVLSGIAKSVWKKHPWYGAGIGAFRLHAPFFATKEDLRLFQPKKADWRSLLITQQMKNATRRVRERGKDAADEFDWTALHPRHRHPACAYNSFWTFLAERGLLGVSLVVLGLGILLFTYVRRLVKAVLFLGAQDDADVVAFACPPIVWTAPFAFVALAALAFYEPILDIAPMLFVLAVPLAVSAASFPKKPAQPASAAKTPEKEGS